MNGTLAFIQIALTSTLRMSVPIVLAAVGAVFSTRAGVVAFGCEGMMLMGAFCGVYGALRTGSNMVGVLFAIVGGILISMLHAYLHVRHKVNGTLSSVCINLIGLSLTELLVKVVWNSNQYSPPITPFSVFGQSVYVFLHYDPHSDLEQYLYVPHEIWPSSAHGGRQSPGGLLAGDQYRGI